MRIVVSALLLSAALGAAGALAETAGVCLGSAEECAAKAGEPERVGFDMLVTFEHDSAELTPDAKATLSQFARALRENRLRTTGFVIEGHADASGPADYNAALSQRRADAVARFLLENGVEPARVSTAGMGVDSPRVEDPYDPVNRRVEVRVTP